MKTSGKMARCLPVLLPAALLAACGCVSMTVVKRRQGNPIDCKKAAMIRKEESTLADVLRLLGAPQEVHSHPDGRILVYRYRARNVSEFSVDAKTIARFVDATQTLSKLLDNLSFKWNRIHADEDRVVVILDNNHRVRGIAYREATRDLPVF
ncbi:MAG: hypothetical protein R6V03_08885 [Kiritimatiellia bacterium]